jgi:hypothetical protein
MKKEEDEFILLPKSKTDIIPGLNEWDTPGKIIALCKARMD